MVCPLSTVAGKGHWGDVEGIQVQSSLRIQVCLICNRLPTTGLLKRSQKHIGQCHQSITIDVRCAGDL